MLYIKRAAHIICGSVHSTSINEREFMLISCTISPTNVTRDSGPWAVWSSTSFAVSPQVSWLELDLRSLPLVPPGMFLEWHLFLWSYIVVVNPHSPPLVLKSSCLTSCFSVYSPRSFLYDYSVYIWCLQWWTVDGNRRRFIFNKGLCLSGGSGLKTWLSTGSGDTSVPSACVTYLKGWNKDLSCGVISSFIILHHLEQSILHKLKLPQTTFKKYINTI